MMISTKGRYALRMMLDFAENPQQLISLKEAAKRQGLSMKYLEAIVASLNRAGLVQSQRGKEGGYRLARSADEISVAEIIRCTEGTLLPVNCPSLDGTPCERASECRSLPLWQALDRRIDGYLSSVSLEDVRLGNVEKENVL